MEHPYLFLVKLFELIGLGHFAHEYPWVIYTWFVMLFLIVAEVAKKITWLIVIVGWVLIIIRIIMDTRQI